MEPGKAELEKMATVEDVWKFLDGNTSKGAWQRQPGGLRSNWQHEASIAARQLLHICRMASGVTAAREELQKELVELNGARVASSAEEN